MLNIFQYLENSKGKKIPLKYKLFNNLLLTEDELTYNGDLNLYNSNIIYLPDNLTINGDLFLSWSKIKSLPDNLTVNGNLYISNTKISVLPDDLYVDGSLWCRNTPLGRKINNDESLLEKYKRQIKGKIIW